MKKILIVLALLIVAFFVIWTLKLRAPLSPDNSYTNGDEDRPWWEIAANQTPTPDEDWILDHEIPDNYIPVLGGDELYMVIDEDGNIIKYRQRVQLEDGTWVWEDVDPNIPQNYVPVPGLDNVYMVTDIDGTVRYYKYTRNADDTYFFTEVDKNGNPLVDDTPEGDVVPLNYVRIDGTNIYAIYNEHGVLIGYKERVLNPDGTYSWVDCDAPTQKSTNEIVPNTGEIPGAKKEEEQYKDPEIVGTGKVNITTGGFEYGKSYVEEETYTDTKHENGWVIIYETIVKRTYDSSGELISTKKEGPNEVNRVPETEFNIGILK